MFSTNWLGICAWKKRVAEQRVEREAKYDECGEASHHPPRPIEAAPDRHVIFVLQDAEISVEARHHSLKQR